MKITIDHPESKHHIPVCLNDKGDVIDPSLGIKSARFFLNLTKEELADRLEVSVSTVLRWESRTNNYQIPSHVLSEIGAWIEERKKQIRVEKRSKK